MLRLDEGGNDKAHIAACRMAARTYARYAPKHMQKVAEELLDWAGLNQDDEFQREACWRRARLAAWCRLVQFGFSINWLDGDCDHDPGWVVSNAKEHKPIEMNSDGWQTRYPTQIEAITAAVEVIAAAVVVNKAMVDKPDLNMGIQCIDGVDYD